MELLQRIPNPTIASSNHQWQRLSATERDPEPDRLQGRDREQKHNRGTTSSIPTTNTDVSRDPLVTAASGTLALLQRLHHSDPVQQTSKLTQATKLAKALRDVVSAQKDVDQTMKALFDSKSDQADSLKAAREAMEVVLRDEQARGPNFNQMDPAVVQQGWTLVAILGAQEQEIRTLLEEKAWYAGANDATVDEGGAADETKEAKVD